MSSAPVIRCDPPDPAFTASIAHAFGEASVILAGEAAVLVGTLVRVRTEYPLALIVPLRRDPTDVEPPVIWMASRDGWSAGRSPPRQPEAAAELADGAAEVLH